MTRAIYVRQIVWTARTVEERFLHHFHGTERMVSTSISWRWSIDHVVPQEITSTGNTSKGKALQWKATDIQGIFWTAATIVWWFWVLYTSALKTNVCKCSSGIAFWQIFGLRVGALVSTSVNRHTRGVISCSLCCLLLCNPPNAHPRKSHVLRMRGPSVHSSFLSRHLR